MITFFLSFFMLLEQAVGYKTHVGFLPVTKVSISLKLRGVVIVSSG